MKYVAYESEGGRQDVVLFPADVAHDTIAEAIGKNFGAGAVLSAGFVIFHNKAGIVRAKTYGGSTSLGINSRPGDAQLVALALNMEAVE